MSDLYRMMQDMQTRLGGQRQPMPTAPQDLMGDVGGYAPHQIYGPDRIMARLMAGNPMGMMAQPAPAMQPDPRHFMQSGGFGGGADYVQRLMRPMSRDAEAQPGGFYGYGIR